MKLVCKNVNVTIGDVRVVTCLDLQFSQGQIWGVLGRNGVGKSTLLNCLAALHPIEEGSIELGGEDVNTMPRKKLAQRLGLLQQHSQYIFDATVLQTALIGRHPFISPWRLETAEDIQLVRDALEQTGLAALESRRVTTLSGGEARRLAFATLLVQNTSVMLLDEPTNHLDLHHQEKLMRQLDGRSNLIVAALHDINLAARYCSHVLLLHGDGEYEAGPTEELLNTERLSRLYQHPVEAVNTPQGWLYYGSTGG